MSFSYIRFKATVESKGLRQSNAAKLLGISEGYISAILSGKRQPSTLLLSVIEAKLGFSVSWIRTGKGWSYKPQNPKDALRWVMEHISGVKKVVIVTYPPLEEGFGLLNGFLLELQCGVISMSGSETRSGYKGGGPLFYNEILKFLRGKQLQIWQLRLSEQEAATLSEMDLATLAPRATFGPDILAKELALLDYERPEMGVVRESEALTESMDSITARIIQFLQDMDEEGRRDILKYLEEKKLLRELMEERRKRMAG